MSFHKTARVEHLGTITFDGAGFTRVASSDDEHVVQAQSSYYLDGSAKIDVGGILERVAEKYAISADPNDYMFEVIRANTTAVFNDNHDGFSRDELLRFDPRLRTAVYLTYREKPHHVNHRTDNPKRARGVLLDAHYNAETTPLPDCPGCGTRTASRENRDRSGIFCKKCGTVVNDEFVEILIGVDKRKDPAFARAKERGQLKFGSMGCTCAETICNVCENVARTRADFCKHIASHKGSLWATRDGGKTWDKVNQRTAESEMAKRDRKFHARDFVRLKADDGYEIRKAAEYCQGVVYDEYSCVHMPADPKAERIEMLSRAASKPVQDLHEETMQLIAAAELNPSGRRRTASQQRTAKTFVAVRLNGDSDNIYVGPTLESARALAGAEAGDVVESAQIEAENASAARELADSATFRAEHEQQGDVTINISDGPDGTEMDVDGEPMPSDEFGPMNDDETSIEDLTDEVMGPPQSQAPGDEPLSPEELGVLPPAGASKEASSMNKTSSFADWKVQVTAQGNARVVAPAGPALIIQAKAKSDDDDDKKLPWDEDKKAAFAEEIQTHLREHGLFATASKYNAAYHARFASVVDFAEDDMVEYSDKNTKSEVATGGGCDMQGVEHPSAGDDIRADAGWDMQEERAPSVNSTSEGGAADHELAHGGVPSSSTENEESDIREPRKPFNLGSDDVLQDAAFDHGERMASVGTWQVHVQRAKVAKIASFDASRDVFTMVDRKLATAEVDGAALRAQWKQLVKEPDGYEDRVKRWANKQIEAAKRAAREEVFDAIKLAAERRTKSAEPTALKRAIGSQLASDKVVGEDAGTRSPLEYRGMSSELAIHLVEASFAEAAAADTEELCAEAAEVLDHDAKYRASMRADLAKTAHRIPRVTTASMVDDLEREAVAARRAASAGNPQLASTSSSGTETVSPSVSSNRVRQALQGVTKAASRTIHVRQ